MRLGGIVAPAAASGRARPGRSPAAPQMIEISRDGRRVYVTNSLYARLGRDLLPRRRRRLGGQVDADIDGGGLTVDPRFFPHGDDFRGLRVHQTRLQGGDASSDSYCFVE